MNIAALAAFWHFVQVGGYLCIALILIGSLACSASPAGKLRITGEFACSGMCDASAGVRVGNSSFLVANDEDNILRLYSSEKGGPPLAQFPFDAFLELEGKSLEADVEGAATLNGNVFWIGSHGRNRIGKERLNRSRLFATQVDVSGPRVTVRPVGVPYKTLLEDLFADQRYDRFQLRQAAGLVPKDEDGLNIEGLAATVDGRLLIGFRNPIPKRKALIVPLLNPELVIHRQSGRFGDPILLDLDGRGIRDITLVGTNYYVMAGAYDGRQNAALYWWSGDPVVSPRYLKVDHIKRYNPEGLVLFDGGGKTDMLVLSDDGAFRRGGVPCKELQPPSRRVFRAFWIRGIE